MSDIPADFRERLNLREQLARIDHALDEAAKFRAEREKLEADPANPVLIQTVRGVGYRFK